MTVIPTLSSEIKASIQWLAQNPLALTTIADNSQLTYDETLDSGTAVDLADRIWSDQRTVAAAANDDLDLTALTESIFSGSVAIDMANIKAILIINTSTTSGDKLALDSSVANAYTSAFGGVATAKLTIGADSACLLAAKKDGYGATGGSNKILRVSNPGANAITYQIAVVGTSV